MTYCKCTWDIARKNTFDLTGDILLISGYRIIYKSFLYGDFRLKISGTRAALEFFKNSYVDLKNVFKLQDQMTSADCYLTCPKCELLLFKPEETAHISIFTQFSSDAHFDLLTYLENMIISRGINYRYI